MNRRNALLTAGTLATVVVAATAAVAASLGILDASSAEEVGQLSAAGSVATTDDTTSDADEQAVTYQVADAGRVTVAYTSELLFVNEVEPSPDWTWSTEQPSPTEIVVDLTGPSGGLRLTVRLVDGAPVPEIVSTDVPAPAPTVAGPVVVLDDSAVTASSPASTPAPAPTSVGSMEDDEHEDESEHEEHEDEEHDDEEHEGRDWDD